MPTSTHTGTVQFCLPMWPWGNLGQKCVVLLVANDAHSVAPFVPSAHRVGRWRPTPEFSQPRPTFFRRTLNSQPKECANPAGPSICRADPHGELSPSPKPAAPREAWHDHLPRGLGPAPPRDVPQSQQGLLAWLAFFGGLSIYSSWAFPCSWAVHGETTYIVPSQYQQVMVVEALLLAARRFNP